MIPKCDEKKYNQMCFFFFSGCFSLKTKAEILWFISLLLGFAELPGVWL